MNVYALEEKGRGSGTGHRFNNVEEEELVSWMEAIIQHGARDRASGSLHQCWIKSHPNYNQLISKSMAVTRFKQ